MSVTLSALLKIPFQHKSPAALLCHMQQRTTVTYFAQRDEEQAGDDQLDALLAGRFTYNGETYQLPPDFDWTVNPSADLEWLILLHKFYFAAGLGDVFCRTGDTRYLDKWVALTERWIDTVPIDFLSSDVTGRRVQNWLYAHHYFVNGPCVAALPPAFYAKFLCSLHGQVSYLCENLTPARNHRTIELYAIFMAAVVFPEFAAATHWLEFARRELEANIQADLRPDGVHCEQSTDYHHLVVKNYLGVKRLALANGIAFTPIFDERLQRALDFVMYVHRPDGMIPALSDGDSRCFLDLLLQGHAIYGNPAWLYVATGGREGTPPPEQSHIFPHAGYIVLRSGWGDEKTAFCDERYLVFDCGPLGEGNHGHLDLLNIEVAAYGKALVVDPGRYTYHEPHPDSTATNWRVYFRGTAAHNTVQVDGLEQARYHFHKKKFKIRGSEPIWDLRAYHKRPDHEILHGYAASAEYDAVHQRVITFVHNRYWIITDLLHAPHSHRYDLRFHLNDHAYGQTALIWRDKMALVHSPHLLLAQPVDNSTHVLVEDGFVSRTYGVKHAAPVVRYSRYAADTIFQTVLYPYAQQPPQLLVQQLPVSASSPYRANALVAGLRVVITEHDQIHEDLFRLHQGRNGTGYDFHYSRRSSLWPPSAVYRPGERNGGQQSGAFVPPSAGLFAPAPPAAAPPRAIHRKERRTVMVSANRGTSATSLQRATIHDSIVRDQTMPQLAIALDPLLMRLHFQSLLFENSGVTAAAPATDYEVNTCEIVRAKYRAGEKCVISYRLQIQKRGGNQLIEQWLSARLFPTGTAASRYHKALREPLTPPLFGDAVMFLPKLDMVIWAFPNDRKIGGLPALLAAARKTEQLAVLVAGRWGATTTIVAHDYQLIHYVPEHTCTVRVQLLLADTATGQTQPATLFAKAYYNEEGAETFRLMQQLWQRAACRQGHLRIAQPIVYCAVDQVLWQEGLPGRTLLTYALGTPAFDELLAEAAQAVARLHTADLPCQRQSAQQEWVNLIDQRKQLVIQSRPHLAGAVDTLAVALRCLTPSISRAPMATLHGDLHLQNFLVDDEAAAGKRVALIDLDNLCTGLPWQDLGSFCAGLYYRGLVDHVPTPLIHRSIDGFLQSYATCVPWSLDRPAINWYTAAALLHERAFRSIARMKEGRLALVDDFVRIATDLLLGQH